MGRPLYMKSLCKHEAPKHKAVSIKEAITLHKTAASRQGYVAGYFDKEGRIGTTLLGGVPILGPFLAAAGAEKENKGRAFAGSAGGQMAGLALQKIFSRPSAIKWAKSGRFSMAKMLGLVAAHMGTAALGSAGTYAATMTPNEVNKYRQYSNTGNWWEK